MDSIVKRLSEIETSAASIVEHAESQKAVLDEEMAKERERFDAALASETADKIHQIHSSLEQQVRVALEQQKEASDQTILSYQQEFARKEEAYAQQILARITEV